MEYIYIARSAEFPGMVKIGKTGRTASERINELSADDCDILGYDGESSLVSVAV